MKIEKLRRQEKDVRIRNRLSALLWLAQGRSAHKVCDIFRCGIAHEFYVKKNSTIHMVAKRSRSGIWQTSGGKYKISVETYCRYLKAAFEGLQIHLFGK